MPKFLSAAVLRGPSEGSWRGAAPCLRPTVRAKGECTAHILSIFMHYLRIYIQCAQTLVCGGPPGALRGPVAGGLTQPPARGELRAPRAGGLSITLVVDDLSTV